MEYRTLLVLIVVLGLLIAVCLFQIARLSDQIAMDREPKPHMHFAEDLSEAVNRLLEPHAKDAPSYPTLWQVMADLHAGNLTLRDAYRIARAHLRAAKRDHRNV
ncbi:hypothetical protein KTE71_30910 [Burkholderia multivorans]|uniref:hypothetical protein n=1 Tax=Burkholderia multivorans TaxID=87883 RepID=UPI001C264891|nr:hypothetical protein [Burkholderia multivorans]MBU9391903.1 hypothetical protein [Burkholderia multivorans]MBY4669632.1 hypothetical protein [Burkholderia multivorans]MCA8260848.1 hypothetical protein [Burkholderia multivorans]MDN7985667.1 hypothetical protein [Burkholderia multivorans]